MAEKHTPLPWQVTHVTAYDIRIQARGENATIAVMGNWAPQHLAEQEANAELIVRAVNNHAHLLGACRVAFGHSCNRSQDRTKWTVTDQRVHEELKAAIEAAEGKQE